ncbi:protoporphyrin IX magnesium-chelatase [Malonomonas rubra DSM 5091]|uniref:Mg-protoporphyrin IX chelatase n=1 Tax=Malonomonas rubra DSM 5091 TaxID=1122189 RepID=A0A1M6I897_MALRU|nr:ATP-binding protein [Malonomonas rubra]SHJ30694.1 protoporphyrin IX magnesium-chelatase [Malonomonas rubra DSM 5091]
MQNFPFPLSAIVGQDAMKAALLLNAVDPSIGGVLIRGQKGTGKSTAARALAALLPAIEVVAGCPYQCDPGNIEKLHDGCREKLEKGEQLERTKRPMPVVELPLSASEDRVVGSVQLEHVLKTGQKRFEPGLLAAANRGILYVDEVNLLEDHLVDLLLDAAASGVNRVEREGLCVTHPSRFMLIGTMNPEEGELRPQFLDRFGLVVNVEGISDPHQRRQLIENRIAYEQNPQDFVARWQQEEHFLAAQVQQAQRNLNQVVIPEAAYDLVVKLAIELQVHGHRADIALLKVARALAALLGKKAVSVAEVKEAAAFVLPHRLPGGTLLNSEAARKNLDDALVRVLEGKPEQVSLDDQDPLDDLDFMLVDYEFPGSAAAGSMLFQTLKKKLHSESSISTTSTASPQSISSS